MQAYDITRALRDKDYRDSLPSQSKQSLPQNAAGKKAPLTKSNITGFGDVIPWTTPAMSCVSPGQVCP